ncbi:3'-5' exonuclease, partial [Acidobacteriota bacterium]
VRIMNLHKAKGLEAPVVFLANPVGSKYFEPDKHVVRLEEGGPRGYFLFKKKMWFTSKVLSQPRDWAEKMKEEKLYAAAEEERLMYVAATRAKNLLVISTYEGNLTRKAWDLLDGYLEGVGELEIPMPAGVVGKKEASVSRKEFEKVRAVLKENIEQGIEPSYLVESVTSLAKDEGELPGWSENGLGMSWGRVVHHVLNVVGRGKEVDLELLVRNALVAEERDLGEKWRMLDLIKAIIGSAFWARMQKAERKYFEIPFSVKADARALKLGKDLPVILYGVIDLVFWEKGGWVIADYKTDEIERSVQRFVDYYTPQVKIYSQFWEQITGERVKEAGLYFTSVSKWVKVN